jgi:NDP-sugar pyrophosphorylase family protein
MFTNTDVIILSAGASSRFWPLSANHHKAFVSILGKTIIEHLLLDLRKTGVKKVVLVVSPRDEEKIKLIVKQNKNLEIKIDYVVQKESLGMGNALLTAQKKIKSQQFFVLNTNHLNASSFLEPILKYQKTKKADMVILGRKTDTPWNYGVFAFDKDRVVDIIEKPEKGQEPSFTRVAGIYLLSQNFLDFMAKQPAEEYQLESSLSKYVKDNKVVSFVTKKETLTLKYPWHLFTIKDFLFSQTKGCISQKAKIAKTAVIKNRGKVIIEDGALIGDFALIEGPAYMGKNAVLGTYSILRKGSVLEEGVEVQRYGDISNSIMGKNTHLHSGFVGDSIMAEGCRLGASFITANRRIDRAVIKTIVKGKVIETGLTSFGTVIGPKAKMGIRVSAMPGKMIGNQSVIGPGEIVKNNIEDKKVIL